MPNIAVGDHFLGPRPAFERPGRGGVSKFGVAWLQESQTTGQCDGGAWIRVSDSGMQSRHEPDKGADIGRRGARMQGAEGNRGDRHV
ncbi:hypothetical protein V491_08668 [Pseudogymnoascus sp. VKM F-3775]|nr:hypothetical protein V491_08668 [Pseudogymnoascus sp. VKM F-3775]